ncbi:helix-turn-helix domain-containing protein [Parahaliea mediterranea]|uniref:helix-turn-helix domain-containing protein n=1 Tax=Parahaliea mediterranea TaxID=651086 RepID=UPI0013007DD3|nr:hypothetical protein [Parahaliea mediterranea]
MPKTVKSNFQLPTKGKGGGKSVRSHRTGRFVEKTTGKSHPVATTARGRKSTATPLPAAINVTAQDIVTLREKLKVSQPVFARLLHTNVKTLRNWEQGIAKPNAQAAVLLRLVERNPAMLGELEQLGGGKPKTSDTDRQLALARRGMGKYRNALRDLAQ